MDLEKTNKMTGMALFKLRGTYLKAKSNNPVKQHLRKLNYRSENNFLLQEIYQYLSQTLIRCTLLFSLFTAKHKQICVQTHIHHFVSSFGSPLLYRYWWANQIIDGPFGEANFVSLESRSWWTICHHDQHKRVQSSGTFWVWSQGLVIMRGDLCYTGHEFKSQAPDIRLILFTGVRCICRLSMVTIIHSQCHTPNRLVP